MICVQATIVNSRGLHARPSAKLAKLAATFSSELTICKGKRRADAKSVAALLMLAAGEGTELKITADGADEKAAAAALLELIASGFSDDAVPNNPRQPAAQPDADDGGRRVHKVSGIGIGEAVVSGRAHIHTSGTANVPRYRIEKARLQAEVARYEKAVAQVRRECEALLGQTAALPGAAEIKPFIDLHLMLLADEEFAKKPQALIRRRLINAEWALKERVEIVGDNFRRLKDAYLRERHSDFAQVMNRLLSAMEGDTPRQVPVSAGENALLVAQELDPPDVIKLHQLGYRGFVTESGGANSHTAILARSMNIPALLGARGVLSCLHHNDMLLVNTREGVAIVNPGAAEVKKHKRLERKKSARRRHKSRGDGVATADGARVLLNTNIELPDEAAAAVHSGADGVGLFRSEFLFMHRADLPSEDEQFEVYRHVLATLHPLPVVIRTLDLGGDKMPQTADALPVGANPALGVRAIRYCLALPDLFMTQLRALLRAAAAHDNLRVLLPMIAHPNELTRTMTLLAAAREQLRATHGIEAPTPPIGAMIEVPAAVFIMRALAKQLDFFSIGTNDLIQYTLAVDRNDETLIPLCDPLHPAVLQLLSRIVDSAGRANVPLTLCGELAGDVSLTPLMLGLGLRELSMAPPLIDAVREYLRGADAAACARMARQVLRAPDPDAARAVIDAARAR